MNKVYSEFSTLSLNTVYKNSSIFFNACFDKNQVKELVSWFLNKYGEKKTIKFLESLKYTGFHQATQAGISLGIEDLEIPPEKPNLITDAQITTHKIEQKSASGSLTSVEKSQYLIDTWNQTSDLLRQNAIQNFKTRNVVNPVYMMAFSGARGNISQVRQLVAMRGLMADPQGAILEFPIQSNFREGLTITEYLISCYGARKGLVDTALRTATSGYLTRRLVDSAQHAVITVLDCGSKRNILLEGKNLETRLVGRILAKSLKSENHPPFFQNQIISQKHAKIISNNYQQVFIRSPLTCEASTSVCQFCYGWNLASGKLVQIGEAVGVIAAQSIGEPGTQLTMRTFHTGGVGVFSDQALKPITAPYDGKIMFSEPIPGHFVRTPHGKIVYMVKYVPKNPNKILFKIHSLEKTDREFIIREQDFPPGSLIFVKNGEFLKAKQLVAQASHLKLTKQKLPESSHPVYSPLEGQIFFESMNLSIEKEVFNVFDDLKKTNLSDKYLSSLKNLGLPDIRRMAKIGSFWVLSGYNQEEFYGTTTSFIVPGDLVSKNTILYNYLFYSPNKTQLYKLKSKLIFARHCFQIPTKTICFSKKIYKFKTANFNEILIYNKQTSNNCSLFWYPFKNEDKNNDLNKVVYTYISSLYLKNFFNEESSNLFFTRPLKGNVFTINSRSTVLSENFNFKKTSTKLLKKRFFDLKKNNNSNEYRIISNNFTKKSTKTFLPIDSSKFPQIQTTLVSKIKKLGWVYIPNERNFYKNSSFVNQKFFPAGNTTTNICFSKHNLSLKILPELRNLKSTLNRKNLEIRNWYNPNNIITNSTKFEVKINFLTNNVKLIQTIKTTLSKGLIWYKLESSIFGNQKNRFIGKSQEQYIAPQKIILIQSVAEHTVVRKKVLQGKVSQFSSKLLINNLNNSLFCKQVKNAFELKIKSPFQLKIHYPAQSGYLSLTTLTRIEFKFQKNSDYPNYFFDYQTLSNNFSRGFSIFQYYLSMFKDPAKFSFQTYLNNWVLPSHSFSIGNVHIKTSGEFRHHSKKPSGTCLSIVRNLDCLSFELKNSKLNQIGNVIRWGEEVFYQTGCDHNGQILKKTRNSITIRLGVPVLASSRGIVHVFQNDLVQKNQLLITLKSRRLQTEDIVQGIPKIEQLFEARESQAGETLVDTVHIRLRNAFVRELELLKLEHWSVAVEKSFVEAQQFLVQNIVDAYGNQGVKISEKHVEVIVRQMTSRVRILEAGETGLLPGELVQHIWIQKFNQQIRKIGLREATYEPIVLGISKSVLQSESFLLAASFQEVSRVLVRSALSKKRDFLRGLHENVIVGQLIPGGTGLINQMSLQVPILQRMGRQPNESI